MTVALELAEYRREVAEAYAEARAGARAEAPPGGEGESWRSAWMAWRRRRDALIGGHPQSPLPRTPRSDSWVTPFWPYDPSLRLTSPVTPISDPVTYEIPHSGGSGATAFTEVGTVALSLRGVPGGGHATLTLFWLEGYGGGLFLPFTDATCGTSTYGGGRYLLDTVKGADLGAVGDQLVLDLNYAYHPSCAWDSAWSCPLAPATNRLPVAVEAGEQLPLG